MTNNKFLTENARIANAYVEVCRKSTINESSGTADWGSIDFIREKFPNDDVSYSQLSKNDKVHKSISDCIEAVKANAENNRLLGLDGVVSCDKGEHYIAFVSGGANGSGDWTTYFEAFKDIVDGLKKVGDAWLIELDNDCSDDVHYALIGFSDKPSSIGVKMTFVGDNIEGGSSDLGDTVRELEADEQDKVLSLVKLFCRNTWPMCDKIVIERLPEHNKK